MATLAELKAAGERAAKIEGALEMLKRVEHTLALVNRYAKENANAVWSPELRLTKEDYGYNRSSCIQVAIPHGFILRQAINAVIDARRNVVLAGGELPTASEQVQRGRQ